MVDEWNSTKEYLGQQERKLHEWHADAKKKEAQLQRMEEEARKASEALAEEKERVRVLDEKMSKKAGENHRMNER